MPKLEWTQTAKSDLYAILEFIADDNVSAAQRLKNTIDKDVNDLLIFPTMGRLGRVSETRELVVSKHYVIVYSICPDQTTLKILRILSSYQNWLL